MRFWTASFVPSVLTLLALLAVAGLLIRVTPALRRLGVPNAILAGLLGLALGPSAADVLPVDTDVLELVVYHAFAVVFISVGLQAAPRAQAGGSVRSFTFALAAMGGAQALLGFALVAAWPLLSATVLHPGFSWLLTLGFMQGPGQALALGSSWESLGMDAGGQLGLIFAALGFGYCAMLGIPLVALGRRRGWIDASETAVDEDLPASPVTPEREGAYGGERGEPLSRQMLLVVGVYLATFALLWAISSALPEGSALGATIWGFHFIVGAGLAIATRRIARRHDGDRFFDDDLLARISVIAVDITTAGAIAAVRLEVLSAWLGPILFISTIGGVLIVITCVWSARRLFPDRPFGHALVLLGASTGTISTGLALLRMLDPELKGPVARNTVIAATATIPLGAPLFLAIIPFSVSLWTSGYATAMAVPVGALVVYLVVIFVLMRRMTPARLTRPLTSLWPD